MPHGSVGAVGVACGDTGLPVCAATEGTTPGTEPELSLRLQRLQGKRGSYCILGRQRCVALVADQVQHLPCFQQIRCRWVVRLHGRR